jgi:hypothetical protein
VATGLLSLPGPPGGVVPGPTRAPARHIIVPSHPSFFLSVLSVKKKKLQ